MLPHEFDVLETTETSVVYKYNKKVTAMLSEEDEKQTEVDIFKKEMTNKAKEKRRKRQTAHSRVSR